MPFARRGNGAAGRIEDDAGGSSAGSGDANGGALCGHIGADVDGIDGGRGPAGACPIASEVTAATPMPPVGRSRGGACGAIWIDSHSDRLLIDAKRIDGGSRSRPGDRREVDRRNAIGARVGDDREAGKLIDGNAGWICAGAGSRDDRVGGEIHDGGSAVGIVGNDGVAESRNHIDAGRSSADGDGFLERSRRARSEIDDGHAAATVVGDDGDIAGGVDRDRRREPAKSSRCTKAEG